MEFYEIIYDIINNKLEISSCEKNIKMMYFFFYKQDNVQKDFLVFYNYYYYDYFDIDFFHIVYFYNNYYYLAYYKIIFLCLY